MRKYISVVILILLFGCATGSPKSAADKWTADKMNSISVGMTREQAIEILGIPSSTSAIGNKTYLSYTLRERHRGMQDFFVRLVDGKIEAFGRRGDFDSTKVPESKTTLDINIKNKETK